MAKLGFHTGMTLCGYYFIWIADWLAHDGYSFDLSEELQLKRHTGEQPAPFWWGAGAWFGVNPLS